VLAFLLVIVLLLSSFFVCFGSFNTGWGVVLISS
jgi:hypothetical protein